MPDYSITILVALACMYLMTAVFMAVQSLECSHGARGRAEDLRVAWEAVLWPLVHVPWRQWFSWWLPTGKHWKGMWVIAP